MLDRGPVRRADARRNEARILDGAARVLAEAPAAGMGAIAEGAGVGRATLYRHFPTRVALLDALRVRAMEEVEEAFDDARPEDGPAPEALARIVGAMIGVGDRYRFLLGEDGRGERPDAERLDALTQRSVAVVARGQAAGELRTDASPAFAAEALGALIASALAQVALGAVDRDEAVRATRALALRGLGAAD